MAAQKNTDRGVAYAVVDAHGNNAKITQGTPVAKVPTIVIGTGHSTIVLSQTNVTDLLPALTVFSATGVLS